MAADHEKKNRRNYSADRFEIVRELGRGGTSIVYLVRSKEGGRQYAMKVLKPGLGEAPNADTEVNDAGAEEAGAKEAGAKEAGEFGAAAAELLRAEAETLEELSYGQTCIGDSRNPGIPAYYGKVHNDGRFAGFLMEYVEGESLQKLLAGGRVFTVREAADTGVQLCRILTKLHAMKPPRIYRDLKPGNILIRGDGSCVLVDYGAVRMYRPGADGDTCHLGTEGYAAPEQYGGWEQSDVRTDVYGVGAVLHHMLAGRPPSETGLRPLKELPAGEGRTAAVRQYSIMERILLRACCVAPSMRYPSCRELEKALARLLRDGADAPFGINLRFFIRKCEDFFNQI